MKGGSKFFALHSSLFTFFCTFAPAFGQTSTGEMVEWSITVVLKTTVPRGTGGSNPSLSAKRVQQELSSFFILFFYKKVSSVNKSASK